MAQVNYSKINDINVMKVVATYGRSHNSLYFVPYHCHSTEVVQIILCIYFCMLWFVL